MTLRIDGRAVGRGEPTFIIAEIGVNHDGSLARALELVDIAADCGADAIKLQVFRARNLMHASSAFADYQRERVSDQSPIEMLERYELAEPALVGIAARAASRNVLTLATPFSLADVPVIERLNLPAVKIASPDIVNLPLLRRAMSLGKPLLISTGAATIEEVDRCVRWCAQKSIALLHCVSSYPVAAEDAHLSWIGELARRFDCPVGFSDHTTDARCGAMSVMAGACIVEKHLTYDCAAAGPDHSASANPESFREYVARIREAERYLGRAEKGVLPSETDVRNVSRQSLVAACSLRRGEKIEADSLVTQRPGSGISAADVDSIVGRTLARDVAAGEMLRWEMFAKTSEQDAA